MLRFPLNPFVFRLSNSISLRPSSQDWCSRSWNLGLPLDSYVQVFLVLGSPELDPVLPLQHHQCLVEGKNLLPWPADDPLPNAANMIRLLSGRITLLTNMKSSSADLLSNWLSPACAGACSCSSPVQDSALLLVELTEGSTRPASLNLEGDEQVIQALDKKVMRSSHRWFSKGKLYLTNLTKLQWND